ncbi:MAG: UvrD-helicase domain-containing protein [Methanomicrobium sp.]|nr:UvrD-helicase domain-containing protein [Methanomicrobium sp.]
MLPEILTDDPDKFCEALSAYGSVKSGNARMGTKDVFGDSLDKLRRSYKLLKDFYSSLPADLISIITTYISADIPRTIEILEHLGRVFNALEDMIENAKRGMGAADFTDMIDLTYLLFTTRSELIAGDYAGRFRFIMIDEFQDTDPTQAEIIYRLIALSHDSGDISEDSPRPCNDLIVVGDPKQSIYLFRDADVTQFKDAGTKICDDLRGGMVTLDVNFRSTEAVLGFVNRLFSDIFSVCNNKWDFGYDPLAVSDKRKNDKGSVELILTPSVEKGSPIPSVLNEALAVASRIRSAVVDGDLRVCDKDAAADETTRPAKYGDIAVLLERRTNLKYFEYALRKYGIPYRVYSAGGLYAKQEIKDCISLFSFLRNRHDGISLYGILRSPWFGFSDAELFGIFNGGNPYSNLRNLAVSSVSTVSSDSPETLDSRDTSNSSVDSVSPSLKEKVRSAYTLLESWRTLARRVSPSKLFARMIRESGLFAVYSGIAGGDMMAANVEKLADIIREHESEGYYTLDKLVYDLCLAAKSDDEEGEADPQPEIIVDNTVSIMTVHASKGLEFPIVILPELGEIIGADRNVSVIVDETFGAGIKIPPLNENENSNNDSRNDSGKKKDLLDSPPLAIQKYLYNRKSHAESKRLFYVACTRARDHLILCGNIPKDKSKDNPPFEGDSDCRTRMDYLTKYLGLKLADADNSVDSGEVLTLSGDIKSGLYDISNDSFNAAIRIIRYEDMPEFKETDTESDIETESAGESRLIDISRLEHAGSDPDAESSAGLGQSVQTGQKIQNNPVNIFDRKFSVTAINTYLAGPKAYRDKYLMHKASNPVIKGLGRHNESVDKGIIIHEIFAGTDPKHVFDRYLVKDAAEMEEYRKCYRNFIGNTFIAGARTIACELEFTVNIGGYIFKGAIDRLLMKDGELMIIDYKTGSKAEESERNSKYAVQMAVYQTAVRDMCGQNARTFIYYTQTDEFGEVVFDASEVRRTIAETCRRIIDEEADSHRMG